MLRTDLNDALKQALRARDARTAATLRLILAALKDRDIAARSEGNSDGISDDQIRQMLQKMVRQSHDAAKTYADAGRDDLAEKEEQEITVLQRFLPRQLDDAETRQAVDDTIEALGADSVKDMGAVMTRLRTDFAGQMDFAKASKVAKERLT
ncbi:GatB/YqeY domain-containing protein [Rhodovibrio salinarum]|uniref:Glutamyl-tRNA amidotransferase n=1 Tax=Rhodovibrio salinarum TaxID=1087 RepID=A0A934V1R8_9PROT|nr:GatB/YqeY domain-containing protein [Rhodovibrio salinarum]MBK1698953.1 glutamyl-tRNA amidotransferase [Rhodovibrio salinarum]